jgi:hypothetical protein
MMYDFHIYSFLRTILFKDLYLSVHLTNLLSVHHQKYGLSSYCYNAALVCSVGHCPQTKILNAHNILETSSISVLTWKSEKPHLSLSLSYK